MDTFENPQRKTASRMLIAAVVSALIAVAPFVIGLELDRGGAPFLAFGAIFCLTFFFVALAYFGNAKKYERLRSGVDLVAHWTYTEDEWQRHVEEQYADEKKTSKGILLIVFVIFLVIAGILVLVEPDILSVLGIIFAAIFIPVGMAAFVAPRLRYARDKKIRGEFFVGPASVLFGRKFIAFDSYGKRFDGAAIERDPASILTFHYSTRGKHGRYYPQSLPVPVPDRELASAQRVVEYFRKKPEERMGPAKATSTAPTLQDASGPVFSDEYIGTPVDSGRRKRPVGKKILAALLLLAIGGAGYFLVTFYLDSKASIGSLGGHESGVKQMIFTPDGKRLITRNFDVFGEHIRPEIKVWEVSTGKLLATIPVDAETMDAMTLSPDGNSLATACLAGFDVHMVAIRDVASGITVRSFPVFTDEIARLGFTRTGNRLIAFGMHAVFVWDAGTGKILDSLCVGNDAQIADFTVTRDDRILVMVNAAGAVTLHEVTRNTPLYTFAVQGGGDSFSTGAFAFSNDGSLFVMEKGDSIVVRETATGNILHAWTHHGKSSWSTSISPDNTSILSRPGMDEAQVWNMATRACVVTESGKGYLNCWFSADGRKVVVTHAGVIDIYDTQSGAKLESLNHSDGVFSLGGNVYEVVFSPDGKMMLTGRYMIRMWKAK
jgi:WD40 repeat protein